MAIYFMMVALTHSYDAWEGVCTFSYRENTRFPECTGPEGDCRKVTVLSRLTNLRVRLSHSSLPDHTLRS